MLNAKLIDAESKLNGFEELRASEEKLKNELAKAEIEKEKAAANTEKEKMKEFKELYSKIAASQEKNCH